MNSEVIILVINALSVYLLVLWAHSLRSRIGLGPFYALLGGITVLMSWITDAGIRVEVAGIVFMVGSTVFYTALLLGVFVVYVFDGPRSTRIAILTIAGMSIMTPLIAFFLHIQMGISGSAAIAYIPVPSLRINTASVLTTIADLIFLAVAWEFLGKSKFHTNIWLRGFITLLGVMFLDVVLFATGAFAGTPNYLNIMGGTLVSRLIISLFTYPVLYVYIKWQNWKIGSSIENRPVLAIIGEVDEMRTELSLAQQEIKRARQAEKALQDSEEKLSSILNNMADVVWSLSWPDLKILYLSPSAENVYGRALNEFRENPALWQDLTHPDDKHITENALEELKTKGVAERECRIVRPDGSIVWIHDKSKIIFGKNNTPLRVEGIASNITKRKQMEDKLQIMATTDELTGLWNRRYFMQAGTQEFERSRRYNANFSLLMLDIDQFKHINDTYGHAAGDEILRQIASLIRDILRKVDIAGRLGGDEFGILLPSTSLANAFALAERMRQNIEQYSIKFNDQHIYTTVSIGVAAYHKDLQNIDDLLKLADDALYLAKKSGRNCVMKKS